MEMTTSAFSKIKIMFNHQKNDRPELGDYINLCYIIKGRNYNSKEILKAFNKLVRRDEFDWSERKDYQDYLIKITKKIYE